MKYLSYTTANPVGLLQRTGAIVATTVLGGLALMFSAMLIVIVLSIAAVACTYLMWKARELRKQMRNSSPCDLSMMHEVIEGEVIRMDETQDKIRG